MDNLKNYKNSFTLIEYERSKSVSRNEGFTLIELLIAIFVLVVGIIAVLQAFPLGMHLEKSAQMMTIAIQLGQEKLEETISKSYSEVSIGVFEETYGFYPNFSSFKRKTEINYFDPNNPGTPPVADSEIKKIEVTVFWHSPLGITEKQIKLATLFTKR